MPQKADSIHVLNTYRVKAGDPEYEELYMCQIMCGKYVTLKHLRGGGKEEKEESTSKIK